MFVYSITGALVCQAQSSGKPNQYGELEVSACDDTLMVFAISGFAMFQYAFAASAASAKVGKSVGDNLVSVP